MQAAEHANNEAVVPEEDSKLPAKRPRRKAALKSEERIAEMADAHEEDVKPPAKTKRRRTTKTKGALKTEEGTSLTDAEVSTPVVINFDAMVNVMEFLPPRSLYNIALTCKSLREMVTTKMVVQSALIHGGSAKTTMEELHKLMSCHSIHVPSPLRLLRLANGKRCEFCFTTGAKTVRPGLGVFACWDCVSGGNSGRYGRGYGSYRKNNSSGIKLTQVWKTSWVRFRKKPMYPTIFSHPRVASNEYRFGSKHYLWAERRSDASGERIGPLVVWKDVDDLSDYYAKLKAADDAKEAANASTAAAAAATTEEAAPSLNNGEWIDYYLTNTLNAPSEEDYAEFNDTFVSGVQVAERVSQEREELKKSKRAGAKQTKVAKVEKMLDDLKALIDEPFREIALKANGKENYLKEYNSSTGQCVYLDTEFINDWLGPYIKSPSKMTKKIMKEMAEKINVELNRIESLLEMNFLSDDDDLQVAAKTYFRECFPNMEALFQATQKRYPNRMSNNMDKSFLNLIDSGRSFEALCYLKGNDLSPMLLVTEPSASLVRASRYLEETSLKNLASRAWGNTYTSTYHTLQKEDDSWVAEAFVTGHKFFRYGLQNAEGVKSWLENKRHKDANDANAILNSTLEDKWYTHSFMKENNVDEIVRTTHSIANA